MSLYSNGDSLLVSEYNSVEKASKSEDKNTIFQQSICKKFEGERGQTDLLFHIKDACKDKNIYIPLPILLFVTASRKYQQNFKLKATCTFYSFF